MMDGDFFSNRVLGFRRNLSVLFRKMSCLMSSAHHIYHMTACTDEICTLGNTLLIGYEMGKGLITHTIESCTHIIRGTIRR